MKSSIHSCLQFKETEMSRAANSLRLKSCQSREVGSSETIVTVTVHLLGKCSMLQLRVVCETVQLLEMLSTLQPREAVGAEADLGAAIASGELPHAQACVLYVLRTGVVEQLSEAGQRLLLERCVSHALAQASAGLCPCKLVPKH